MSVAQTAVFAPQRPSASARIALWVLIALFVQGVAALVYALGSAGPRPDFASFTVSFLYLTGISQAGVVFCAITRLMHAQWSKPYYRLAELSTLAFFPFAIACFLLVYGYARDDLFYWLNPSPGEHLNPWLDRNWLLIRNLFGLLLFYGMSVVYVMKSLQPDLAGRANAGSADHRRVERQLYLMSPLVLLVFVVCNTFLAWDFGMMLIPHWHSTVFPIYFWFGNLYAGTAALLLFPVLLFRTGPVTNPFTPEVIRSLGMLINGFTLMWLYFFWAQFFVIWFGNLPRESEPLWRQMYGHYGPYFWIMMTGCFFLPFAAFLFAAIKRSLPALCIIAVGINLGIWISKYLMVVPALSPDHRLFSNWLDLSLAAGLFAGFAAVVVLLANRLPKYSYWELRLKPEPRH
jgi:hypothetical protein